MEKFEKRFKTNLICGLVVVVNLAVVRTQARHQQLLLLLGIPRSVSIRAAYLPDYCRAFSTSF